MTPRPFPSTPTVPPPESRAAWCATASSPRAIPLTTTAPARAISPARARHGGAAEERYLAQGEQHRRRLRDRAQEVRVLGVRREEDVRAEALGLIEHPL